MPQLGGKPKKSSKETSKKTSKKSSDSKRHFTVVMGGKEHGLYVSSTPSSAARKAVTKLLASNKSKKVEFCIREITQGSKKKTYGTYIGYIEKLKKPIELKGRVIKYKPIAKLSGKKSEMKGGGLEPKDFEVVDPNSKFKYEKPFIGENKLFFGKKIESNGKKYFTIVLYENGSFGVLFLNNQTNNLEVNKFEKDKEPTSINNYRIYETYIFTSLDDDNIIPESSNIDRFSQKTREQIAHFKNTIQKLKIMQKQYEVVKKNLVVASFYIDENTGKTILCIQFKNFRFFNEVSNIKNKESYYLFDNNFTESSDSYLIGNFYQAFSVNFLKERFQDSLDRQHIIIIKIGPKGSLIDLLGQASSSYVKEEDLSDENKLDETKAKYIDDKVWKIFENLDKKRQQELK